MPDMEKKTGGFRESWNLTAQTLRGEAAGQGIPKGVPCPAVFAFGQIGGEFILNANMAYGFTETELDIAKHTDLPDLLSSLGYTLKRIGSYYTTAEMDSIRIKERHTWRRYSTRQALQAIRRRIQSQMNGLEVSSMKVGGRIRVLDRFLARFRKAG